MIARVHVAILVNLAACSQKTVPARDTSQRVITPDAAVDAALAAVPDPEPDEPPPPIPTGPSSWRWENPRIPAEDLHGVWGSSATDVYAVGAHGTILHSRDGGRVWTRERSGTAAILTGVWGSGADDVYVVGYDRTILHSTDGGTTWKPQKSPAYNLVAIWGSGKRDVYILEKLGVLLHSTDLGKTWKPKKLGRRKAPLEFSALGGRGQEVYIVGVDKVNDLCKPGRPEVDHECSVAFSRGMVLSTADGGKTWTHESTHPIVADAIWVTPEHRFLAIWDEDAKVESIQHVDSSAAVTAVHTTAVQHGVHAIWGNSASDVFAVGAGGILHSTDGRTWTPRASGATPALRAVWGSGKHVFAVGDFGTIVLSTDGGATWTLPAAATAGDLMAVWGAGGTVLAVGEEGAIVRRAGGNWTSEASGTTEQLVAIWGSGKNDVFVVGVAGAILHGTGAGRPWTRQTSGVKRLRAVWGSGKDNVFVLGSDGAILRTTDSGRTWTRQASGTTEELTAIWGSGTDIHVAGSRGAILYSSDAGRTWGRRADVVKPALGGLDTFAALWGSKDELFLVGNRGILRSADAGTTWQVDPRADAFIDRDGSPWAVWGSSTSNVYVLANRKLAVAGLAADGAILRSTDGGKRWVPIPRPDRTQLPFLIKHWGNALMGIWGNEHEVYVVGWAGTILRYGP